MTDVVRRTLMAAALALLAYPIAAQERPPLERAVALVAQGRLGAAESLYDSLLSADAENLTARLGRAHVRTWRDQHAAARADFRAVLEQEPTNISALVGLGYSFAWAGEFDRADERFRRALAVAPAAVDPAKGLAYVALWRGAIQEAVGRFTGLCDRLPNDAELAVGLGQAQLAAGRPAAAARAFRRALELDPARADARSGLDAAATAPSTVELSLWAGYTAFADGPAPSGVADDRFGLRRAELAVWPIPTLRVFAQLDNGLSLDNRALATAGERVMLVSGGALLLWSDRFHTRAELGRRTIGDIGQMLYGVEQVVMLPGAVTLKAGGWVGPRDDDRTEWVLQWGIGSAVGSRAHLAATFFLSDDGFPNEDGFRTLVAGDYRFPGGWDLGGGLAIGRTATGPGRTSGLVEGQVALSGPLAAGQRWRLLVRHQNVRAGDDITVAAVGITLGLFRR